MQSNMIFFYAKEDGHYLNYLMLFASKPLRLQNSSKKEALLYTLKQIQRLAVVHGGIEIELKQNFN